MDIRSQLKLSASGETDALTETELDRYSWQFGVAGFGEAQQRLLKKSSVLVTRCGGLGGPVAQELAVAGVGSLFIAHGGTLRRNDLNRQILGKEQAIGQERAVVFSERLRDLNPSIQVVPITENVSEKNAETLVDRVDLVIDCAPLFSERYALNRAVVKARKPMVECAVYDLEGYITTIIPGETPCLRCVYPEASQTWVRKFPVFGAVSGVLGCLAAIEGIKLISGIGNSLGGNMLVVDLRETSFKKYALKRDPNCLDCSTLEP